jgi:hypothetical protein
VISRALVDSRSSGTLRARCSRCSSSRVLSADGRLRRAPLDNAGSRLRRLGVSFRLAEPALLDAGKQQIFGSSRSQILTYSVIGI